MAGTCKIGSLRVRTGQHQRNGRNLRHRQRPDLGFFQACTGKGFEVTLKDKLKPWDCAHEHVETRIVHGHIDVAMRRGRKILMTLQESVVYIQNRLPTLCNL